jgi:hypothetical protein
MGKRLPARADEGVGEHIIAVRDRLGNLMAELP